MDHTLSHAIAFCYHALPWRSIHNMVAQSSLHLIPQHVHISSFVGTFHHTFASGSHHATAQNTSLSRGPPSAFARDATNAASDAGISVVLTAEFELGGAGIQRAVGRIAQSGARVILCISFPQDITTIAKFAEQHGLLSRGYAWIAPAEALSPAIALSSPDPESTMQQLSGWFIVSLDMLYGEQGIRFQSVFDSEPLLHNNSDLVVEDIAPTTLAEAIAGAPCDQFCALVYDGMWTTAIALARVGVGADGSVDKEALLVAIRNV
eukprot:1512161-Rhodomonas_salina.1